MTKHKQNGLRPTKSPHDGIHTCSKGCKKPWCNRGLRDEIDELKAEVESLKKPAVIGGYNISEYIRMANSETLEFDNGDIFADMTLPERIKYIVKSHALLKAEVDALMTNPTSRLLRAKQAENTVLTIENDSLKAEVEGLRKAGDELLHEWSRGDETNGRNFMKGLVIWNAAKESKPSV